MGLAGHSLLGTSRLEGARAATLADDVAFAVDYRALTADSFAGLSTLRSTAGPSPVLGVTAARRSGWLTSTTWVASRLRNRARAAP